MNRICVFVGHYGSGKTENALRYAFELKKEHDNVAICDLDIVNPYFRTHDAAKALTDAGIRVIANEYANTNLDLPTVPSDVLSVFSNPDCHAVLDVGGDDDGAICLGQYYPYFAQIGYDMFLVFNLLRPDTAEPEQVLEMVRRIEAVSRLKVTGLINNTNLSYLTEEKHITQTYQTALKCAEVCGIPLIATAVAEKFVPSLPEGLGTIWPLDLRLDFPFDPNA
ncbi:MAG: ATP-binding protein [Ruminococcaceae bacterium]|nr:ATP-binding protein [Oscillospiraceae bacterium]